MQTFRKNANFFVTILKTPIDLHLCTLLMSMFFATVLFFFGELPVALGFIIGYVSFDFWFNLGNTPSKIQKVLHLGLGIGFLGCASFMVYGIAHGALGLYLVAIFGSLLILFRIFQICQYRLANRLDSKGEQQPAIIHSRRFLTSDQRVVVNCNLQCTVMLTDDMNFRKFKKGRSFQYIGGLFVELPAILTPPNNGNWNITLDHGEGSTKILYDIKVVSAS